MLYCTIHGDESIQAATICFHCLIERKRFLCFDFLKMYPIACHHDAISMPHQAGMHAHTTIPVPGTVPYYVLFYYFIVVGGHWRVLVPPPSVPYIQVKRTTTRVLFCTFNIRILLLYYYRTGDCRILT